MSIFQPRTTKSSLWPFFGIAWIFGGTSIRVGRVCRVLYSTTITVIAIFVCVSGLANKNLPQSQMTKILGYLIQFTEWNKVLMILVSIWLWDLKGARAVEKSIEELTKLDEELANFNLQVNYKTFLWKQLFTICGFLAFFIFGVILQQYSLRKRDDTNILENSYWKSLAIVLAFYIPYLFALMLDLLFVVMLDAFQIRFKLVNQIFTEIAQSKGITRVAVLPYSSQHPRRLNAAAGIFQKIPVEGHLPSSYLMMERVDRASRIHRRLLKAVKEVRDAFSLQLCIDFPLLSFAIIVVTFSLVSLTYDTEKEVWQACECAVVILFLGGKFLLVVITCSKTSDEANEFGISLYRVPIQDSAAHNQLREHSIRIMKQKLVFTAGGVFTVDRKLSISVFSNLIKYLIIFYQLRRIYT